MNRHNMKTNRQESNSEMDIEKTKETTRFHLKQKKEKRSKGITSDRNNLRKKQNESPQSKGKRCKMRKKVANSSAKQHDMPMGKKDLYFALDCEMVGVGPSGAQSALARVSIVNYDYEVVLDTFVKVPVPVTDYRTFISGIRSEDIESKNAMKYEEVREAVKDILRGKILIGHALENDLNALMITHPLCDTRDTATYEPFMKKVAVGDPLIRTDKPYLMLPRKLKDLVREELKRDIQILGDAHSPIEDATAALELYRSVRNEWETLMSMKIKNANDMYNNVRVKRKFPINFTKVHVHPVLPPMHPLILSYDEDTILPRPDFGKAKNRADMVLAQHYVHIDNNYIQFQDRGQLSYVTNQKLLLT